ncbi:MAG: deoxyribodipyrimidine photo-lyase [Acidimicrobiales bacterium]|nr:deoxyribodipyrimidine photo-lyase [Acidimicrobiales bacterium]
MQTCSIAWFRRDLRLSDNPAWSGAQDAANAVPLVVREPRLLDTAGPFRRRAFLDAVDALGESLAATGVDLRIESGDPTEIVAGVAAEIGASAVHVNADVTRWATRRDDAVSAALGAVPLHPHWGTLVHAPGTVLTKKGTLSRVFTPFHKQWQTLPLGEPLDLDESVPEPLGTAVERAGGYPATRDLPGVAGTTDLSTALRFGMVSARAVVRRMLDEGDGGEAIVRQLAWRDWYAHITLGAPDIDRVALRSEFDAIPWETGKDADAAFAAWSEGRTGYPIVDAGMRQLRETGWMHNRVRMISASFLVKDLLIDWRRGERFFRHWLRDGDIPSNAGNWQWVAGTGPDAAPYFRVFNPVTQSRRFDPYGAYIRSWVPELAGLDSRSIHAPWEAVPVDLAKMGVGLGVDYPTPIVDHALAREETLRIYKAALQNRTADPLGTSAEK